MFRGGSRFGSRFGGLRDPRLGASNKRPSSLLTNGRVFPPPEEEKPEHAVRRRPPVSPVHEEGGRRYVMPIVQSPKLLRDRLYDKLCDWEFHSLAEFDEWMPEREWVRGMLDLVHWGFCFDRSGQSPKEAKLRLRKQLPSEPRQSVVDLLSGLTVTNRIEVEGVKTSGVAASQTEGDVEEEQPFEPGQDQGEVVPEEDELVLDEERTLVLSMPDYVTDTSAILARKGSGKTYLAMVIAEAFLQSSYTVPFAVIDPTGCWYGLLAKADGFPADHSIVIFGGEHGQYPMSSNVGRLMANVVIGLGHLPVILDLSLFSQSEQHRFSADFFEELYLRNRSPLHVFIDEADIFVPQKLEKSSKHHGRCLAALDNAIRRGRFRGIGNTLVSQRPAVINKNSLSQIGSMFLMHMIAPQDLDAVERWLHDNIPGEAKDICRADLPVMGRGVAYYLRGGERSMLRRFKVRPKTTFDSSLTPKMIKRGDKVKVCSLSSLSEEDRKTIAELYVTVVAPVEEVAASEATEPRPAEAPEVSPESLVEGGSPDEDDKEGDVLPEDLVDDSVVDSSYEDNPDDEG